MQPRNFAQEWGECICEEKNVAPFSKYAITCGFADSDIQCAMHIYFILYSMLIICLSQ